RTHPPLHSFPTRRSSDLLPSRFQADCKHPERVLVGHPFNPAYLLPLVEVLGGKKTSAAAIEMAVSFYRQIGMRPLRVKVEVPALDRKSTRLNSSHDQISY